MSPDAIRGEIIRLADTGLDRHGFARAAMRVLRRVVPFDGAAVVWFDPATALPVDTWIDDAPSHLTEADVNQFRELAASGRRADSISDGGKRELRAVCVSEAGMWGAIALHRERGASHFTVRDVNLLASLSGGFTDVQRVRLEGDPPADACDRDPGLLLLGEDGIELANDTAAEWLDELGHAAPRLPLVVTAVARRARAVASGRTDVAATARVRARSGRWLVVRGSVLCNGTRDRTAVTLQPARAPELAELVADAHRLSERERRVTELVAQGLPTAAIADRLFLSTYTVQDHLKAIFEKLGVSNRGELVARLFLDHARVGA